MIQILVLLCKTGAQKGHLQHSFMRCFDFLCFTNEETEAERLSNFHKVVQ